MKKLLLVLCLLLALTCFLVACDEGGDTPVPDDAQNEEQNSETHTHEWSAWETVRPATCTEEGEKKHSCSCGASEIKAISARGCIYNTQNVCTVCNTALQYTEGLEYILNSEEESYTVKAGTALNHSTDIVIPYYYNEKPITVIGELAFASSALTSIQIPTNVTGIEHGGFFHCENLKDITIPTSMISIGVSAFFDCGSLASINIPESVTNIGYNAFAACDSLAAVHIPSIEAWCNIKFEGNTSNPLYYAKNLYVRDSTVPTLQIEIPNTVTAIKAHAFCNWNGRYITIPKSVTSIGWGAFHGCIQLIQLEGGVCYLDKWALGFFDESVTKITLRDDTVGIADQAFCDFSDLASISIPFGVTSIGDYAFCDCDNLTSITIPSSVTSIGDEAFSLCDSLTSVTFENTAGWCASQDENATSGMSISATDLADPATAATYLTDTYYNYYWKRT